MRNALRVRATAAREPPRVPPSAPLSCSLPQRPAVPGPLGAWHPSSRVLTESGAARRLPSCPLRTLRSNQEEQEEEEDEQNGRRHQPGRKRGTAQARPARSPLRPAATACKRDI
ncbi:protein bassoon-like [Monodon monoceros]|uniref:protein bassoon-like n=1 Tax=Monodon monoceros TaxID=40151 RepID=UPI0010F5DD8A|nr:protein bassoon-like [Monodon monoceros]